MTTAMQSEPWDLLIAGATVYDGLGSPATRADIAVRGDRIAAVGELEGRAASVIDARGLALSPGFIDVHSHDDVAVLLTPEMDFKVMQGVTTDVVGNCGLGAAPYSVAARMFRSFHPDPLPEWEGFRGYLSLLDSEPASLNVAVLVGHNALRWGAMGGAPRPPGEGEMGQMRAGLEEGLEAGALGMSTGLIYEPGRYATPQEIAVLAADVGRAGGLYASHMRDEASRLLDSVRETIAVADAAGVPVQISHHKATGRRNWGRVRDSLRLIDEATGRGLDVTADQYPYTSGSTMLHAVVQNGALSSRGEEGALGRIAPKDVLFASVSRRPQWEGRTLEQVARGLGIPPELAARRVLKDEAGAVVIVEVADEADVRTVLRHPSTMIGSDGVPAPGSNPHPRLYGTFPRVLGRYVREQGVLPLEEAIRRMTGLPARKFRLADRGVIRPGAFADLVLFDPAKIVDEGTYATPRRYPRGIRTVLVNGVRVVDAGEHTGARPGKALRRAAAGGERGEPR